jgi:hypothetical protein
VAVSDLGGSGAARKRPEKRTGMKLGSQMEAARSGRRARAASSSSLSGGWRLARKITRGKGGNILVIKMVRQWKKIKILSEC